MAPIPPHLVKSPISRIASVKVLHDGTVPGGTEFSVAELTLKGGKVVMGIRHDTNYWNPNTIDKGYPTVRGGRPSWFILPDNWQQLIPVLVKIQTNGTSTVSSTIPSNTAQPSTDLQSNS